MMQSGQMASPSASPVRASPTRSLAFSRLHGLGNDYVFVREDEFAAAGIHDVCEAVRRLSDRHRGVGGDGVISVGSIGGPAPSSSPRLRMRMWNADGSEGGMCGNGVRGAVRFAIEAGLVHAGEAGVDVEIGDRVVSCRVVASTPCVRVSVDMGGCDVAWPAVPFRPVRPLAAEGADGLRGPDELDALGASADLETGTDPAARIRDWLQDSLRGWSVASMGNPHLVLAISETAEIEAAPLDVLGPSLERAAAFPERTNVHLVEVRRRDRFRMRTWERGTGPTLACGSGACAAFAILRRSGELDAAATAMLDGGELELAMLDSGRIEMTGPTEACCTGTVDLAALLAARRREPGPLESPLEAPFEIDLVEGGAT